MSTNTALGQIKNRVEGHSATPWQVEPYLHSMYDRVRVTSPDDGPDFNTAEDVLPADAELIAAAPKMLAALEAIERAVDVAVSATQHDVATHTPNAIEAVTTMRDLIHQAIEEALR